MKKIKIGSYGYTNFKRKKKKMRYIIMSVLLVILVFISGFAVFAGNVFFDAAIKRSASEFYSYERIFDISLYNAVESRITIDSYDKLKLSGILLTLNKPTEKIAVIVHGYMGSAEKMKPVSPLFLQNGFNVLLIDSRGHGESEGEYIGMGWNDRFDVLSWITEIIKGSPNAEIVLYGVSMGAAAVLSVSGEILPGNVKCIIEDCGYTNGLEVTKYHLKNTLGLPVFPFAYIADIAVKIRAGYRLSDASPLNSVKKSKTPTLFIHGGKDSFVPSYMLEELYSAAVCEKEMLLIKDSEHEEVNTDAPDEYTNTILNFIRRYVPADLECK